jgi:hypothetical protein
MGEGEHVQRRPFLDGGKHEVGARKDTTSPEKTATTKSAVCSYALF